VAPCKYSFASAFQKDGYAFINLGAKKGTIDLKGTETWTKQ
jgi:hypothetical protein